MSRLVTETIVPSALDAGARGRLADELYEAHCLIFEGVDKETFVKYVVESKAQYTWIQTHRNGEGRIVGYGAAHVFEKRLAGEDVAIFRGESGMVRDYRGGGKNIALGIDRVVRYMWAHPGRPLYYLGALVHPSGYLQLTRYADRVWPNPDCSIPVDLAALMEELGRDFGLERVAPATPLVRKVGWVTRDEATDSNHWKDHASPAVQFFLRENPGYLQGNGLLTLVPITLGGVVRSAGRFAIHKAKRRARKG